MGIKNTMKALSDPTRRKILDLLKDRPMTAGEIGENFSMTGASISHHLSILKNAQLVLDDKRGKYIYYEINLTVIEEVMQWFQELRGEVPDEEEQK